MSIEMTKKKWSKDLRRQWPCYILVAPYALFFAGFVAYPIFYSLWISFHEGSVIATVQNYVGWRNYLDLLHDPLFWKSLYNILVYSLINIPGILVFSLILALLVNRAFRLSGFYRSSYFLPVVVAPAVVALIWSWIYAPDVGLLNRILEFIGLPPQPWLTSSKQAMPAVAILNIWRNSGYFMVLWLAGLQEIPESLYEAARIDGATKWDEFRHVTLPMLAPISGYIIILLTIMALRLFVEPYALTEGGPANSTLTPIMYLYFNGFRFFRMGYASALGILIVAMTFGLSWIERWYFDRKAIS